MLLPNSLTVSINCMYSTPCEELLITDKAGCL
jgi:hypothetical protein